MSLIDAPVQRLFEADRLAGRHHFDRARLADEAREALRSAGAGQHAERDFGKADLAGVFARDAHVGGHRDLQAAADAVAVERGDHELRRLLQPRERFVGVQAEHVLELRRHRVEHADVRAGREELLALAGEHDHFDVGVEARVENRFVELAHHFVRVRIRRRIVHLDEARRGRLSSN